MQNKIRVFVRQGLLRRAQKEGSTAKLKRAYNSALKRSSTTEEAQRRMLFDEVLSEEMQGLLKNKGTLERIQQESLAMSNSEKKHGFNEAYERMQRARVLRNGRRMDAAKEWGWSFNAGLSTINHFYAPINLLKVIEEYKKTYNLKQASILEIGGGSGKAASELKEKLGEGINLTVTGLRREEEWAKQKNAGEIKWKVAHSENLSRVAKAGSVDIIHSNLGLGHAVNIQKALNEAHRVLKRGGKVLFTAQRDVFGQKAPQGFAWEKKTIKILQLENKNEPFFVYLLQKI